MVWSLASAKRRRKLVDDAATSRASMVRWRVALVAIIVYNIVGVFDIISTTLAIASGAGEESNPFILMFMENIGAGWVMAKLALQWVISVMVLWFPHWIVLAMFWVAIVGNSWVVYNNFVIAGFF